MKIKVITTEKTEHPTVSDNQKELIFKTDE